MREKCERLLDALMEAIEAAKEMLPSEDENVRVFAIDAIQQLSEKAMMLMTYLEKQSRSDRNPLARRVRLNRGGGGSKR